MKVTSFQARVYAATRKIPKGRVSTYKQLAAFIQCKSPRAVGQALRHNPFAPEEFYKIRSCSLALINN